MSLKQIVVKQATTMSLHERFTKIRKNKEATSSGERVLQQLASSRNRRLAQQMERRPSVAAALRKDSIKSRLGLPGAISVRERLRYPRGFSARRGRGSLTGKSPLIRGLGKMHAMDVDVNMPFRRARSPFVVSNKLANQRRSRSRSRSRPPPRSRSQSRNRSASITRYRTRSRSRSRSRFGSTLSLRGQFSVRGGNFRRGRGLTSKSVRNDLRSYRPKLTGLNTRGGFRRRGSFRGRGRGRGAGRNFTGGRGRGRAGYQNRRVPTKEELDRELDQYMSTTKASLDKELDSMMNADKWD